MTAPLPTCRHDIPVRVIGRGECLDSAGHTPASLHALELRFGFDVLGNLPRPGFYDSSVGGFHVIVPADFVAQVGETFVLTLHRGQALEALPGTSFAREGTAPGSQAAPPDFPVQAQVAGEHTGASDGDVPERPP